MNKTQRTIGWVTVIAIGLLLFALGIDALGGVGRSARETGTMYLIAAVAVIGVWAFVAARYPKSK